MMRKRIHSFILFSAFFFNILILSAQSLSSKQAEFDAFTYSGNDTFYNQQINQKNEYFNPILLGFYPDPSVCKKGDDYYMVNSSFSFFPGIPLFHSKDLVNWTQIAYVLDRPSQLNLANIRISGGIYAPSITYNKQNQTFYLVTTCIDGIGNFVVKTKDITKAWSDPVVLPHVGGIDPSLFFDDNGKAYIVNGDNPPKSLWKGHRAIWIHEYDLATDKTIGEGKVIIDGGVDYTSKPISLEGPHIYKKNDYYYLMAAEGGTYTGHSEVVFRSKNIMGKYVPYKHNPILTQRDLPEDRNNKVTSTGHADLIQDKNGRWWAVFLGCRPYGGDKTTKGYYNTGRETFLLPVNWKGDFPIILGKHRQVPLIVGKAKLDAKNNFNAGNFEWKDSFESENLNLKWNTIRTPERKFYEVGNGSLKLNLQDKSIYMVCSPSFLGIRQQHIVFEVSTLLKFMPENEKELAGMVCFQNEKYNFVFGKTIKEGRQFIELLRAENTIKLLASASLTTIEEKKPIYLKIKGDAGKYSFYYSFDNTTWKSVAENVDATNLSSDKAYGFTGTYLGLYATSAAQNIE